MTAIDCVCNTCTAIHTCAPSAARYVRNKYLVPNYNPTSTDVNRAVQRYRIGDAYSYYICQRRAALRAIGRAYDTLLRLQNATPATLDPIHIYNFVVDGYDRDEPQRAFFRNVLHGRVSSAFEVFLGRERAEKYADALRRAEAKFNGEYERPLMGPMFEAGQAKQVFKHLNFLHNLHWSKKFPGQVAYAESYDKLVADRWTTCKPGRYLTKFFSDVLDENQLRAATQYMAAATLPAELHFVEHDDPDGWVHVYDKGPYSCMQHDNSVKVYAHDKSVLRLAYLKQNDIIMARCIVREDTKKWIRCYPNTDSEDNQRWHSLMQNHVTSAGYTPGNLHGVLLDAIKIGRSYDSRYVCPYIDSGNALRDYLRVELQYSGGKEYLRLGDDGDATNTGGYVDLDNRREACADCNDMYDPDEMGYIEDHGSVCGCCMRDNYTMAYGRRYEELTPNDEVIQCESTGCSYQRGHAHYHGVYKCEVTNTWYHIDDLCSTKDGYAHVNECTALDVDDSEGNSYAIEGSTTTTWDNRVIRNDESCVWFGKVCHKDDDPNELNETNEEGNE
jgi:ribosomal protein L16/L10AE